MPSATDNYRKVGDMWERGMALLAWKLDGRGGYDRRRRSRSQGHQQRTSRLPDNKRGGRNNKYTAIIAIQKYGIADTKQRGSNAVFGDFLGARIYPGMTHQYRLITGQMIRRGRFH